MVTNPHPTTTRFTETLLQYTYAWTGTTKPTRSFSDTDYIDVTNGYEVLSFINYFFESHNLSSSQTFKKIECLLHHLPITINTRKEITAWIRKSWNRKLYGERV
jgi:hypothetical protein